MSDQALNMVVLGTILLGMLIFAASKRIRFFKKILPWEEVEGIVLRSSVGSTVGDAAIELVDVEYEFESTRYTASDISVTHGLYRPYYKGEPIKLLVDPRDPSKCTPRTPATWIDRCLKGLVLNQDR